MAANRSVFVPRKSFKPYEYPEIEQWWEAIQHSYWLVSEFNFTADVQDFHTRLNQVEQSAIKNTLLAISQIEVSVKRFWAKLGDRLPKPEFEQAGIVMAESEIRHAEAYSHLLKILGLDDQFSMLMQNPVIQGRVDYMTKYLKGDGTNSNESFTLTLALFSLFIENVSLFCQFAIIKSFAQKRNVLRHVDNVVQATQREELLHAKFGAALLHIIKRENPEWFHDEFIRKLDRACKKAYAAESKILDWIFEAGELDFITKDDLDLFLKDRFNQSLQMIGVEPLFPIDRSALHSMQWFEDEMNTETAVDFFSKKSTAYSKRTVSIGEDDLF